MQKDLELIRRLNDYQKWIPYIYDSDRIHENNITLGNNEIIISKVTLYGKLDSDLIIYPFGKNIFESSIKSVRCHTDDQNYYDGQIFHQDNIVTITVANHWKEGDILLLEIIIF